jgi:DNA replication and repair protein RecF
LLIGANAQGKSNLLEAVAMLATGKSFRTTREIEVIRFGQALAGISGIARVAAGTVNLACTIAAGGGGTRKTYTLNGEGVKYARFLGSFKVVTFTPNDLALVWGAPALRRAMVNESLALADPRYYHELARYRKAMLQKNALLRNPSGTPPDTDLLDVYDATLVSSGTELILARRHYLSALGDAATGLYGHWIQNERLQVAYVPNVPAETPTRDAVGSEFTRRLAEQRPAELARKRSLVGPHRDEIELRLSGEPLARFGSQGQQRTAVLALRLAEYAVLRDLSGEPPVLLLDDVLSELDAERAAAFLSGLQAGIEQAFLTATHRPEGLHLAATTWNIALANVVRC